MQIPDDLDALANSRTTTAPCVFILSGSDHLVPPYYQKMVVHAYAGPNRIIDLPGLGHDAALPHEAAEQLQRDQQWLWEQVDSVPADLRSAGTLHTGGAKASDSLRESR